MDRSRTLIPVALVLAVLVGLAGYYGATHMLCGGGEAPPAAAGRSREAALRSFCPSCTMAVVSGPSRSPIRSSEPGSRSISAVR